MPFRHRPYTLEEGPRRFKFTAEVTEEMIINPENYETVFHRHTVKCFSTVDSDGECQSSKHRQECYKKVDQKQKVSYHIKVHPENPSRGRCLIPEMIYVYSDSTRLAEHAHVCETSRRVANSEIRVI